MSVNLYWSPIGNGKCFGKGSGLYDVLRVVFGETPIHLDESHLSELRAIRLTDPQRKDAMVELEEAIHAHGKIEIRAEY